MGDGDSEEGLACADELAEAERRVGVGVEEEASGVKAGEVQAVVEAVAVGLLREVSGVPVVEGVAEHEADLEVEVGTLAVDAGT